MTASRYQFLEHIGTNPWSRPCDIAAALGWPYRRVSKQLAKTRIAGLVRRSADATYALTLSSGKTVTGMIVEEKGGVVKVIENPVASAKPLEVKAEDIEVRKKAATSIMPKGALDKLTKDEILDLTAYVWGKADPKSKLFGGHDHK